MSTSIAVKDVKVRKDFNPRQELQGVTELADSMKLIGVLVPILLDSDGYLVDGHRRLAAAKKAKLTDIPFAVVGTSEELNGAGAITAATVANIARDQLSPAEEADAIQRMLDAGLTPDGAAKALGISGNRVTRRLELLKVPAAARGLWGGEKPASLDAVPAAASLLEKVPALAPLVAYAHEQGHEVTELDRDPARYIDGVRAVLDGDDAPAWPKDLAIVNADAYDLHIDSDQTLGINLEHIKRYKKAYADGRENYVYGVRLRFTDEDVDAARAAGVLVELEQTSWSGRPVGTLPLIVDKEWIKDRIENTVVPRFEKQIAAAVRKEQKARGKTPAGAGGDDAAAAKEAAAKQKQRDNEKRWASLAPGANLDLGRELLNKLASTKLTVDVARFFAETSLGPRPKGPGYNPYYDDSAMKLAAAGLRYVMPGWQTEIPKPTKSEPDKTKTVYLEPKDAEVKLWEWFDGARTAEEILGRALVIHAAARWAVENCVPQSSRRMPNHGSTGTTTRAVVPVGPARDALEKITDPIVPQSIKDLIADIRKGAGRR
jgi:ParB/RepB/Spo0J family partition protein